MKIKLFILAAMALVCANVSHVFAQTDVTVTYITNPGFDDCPAATVNVASSGENTNSVNYESYGWTNVSTAEWSCSAVVERGGSVTVNGVMAPSGTGNVLGISVGWGGLVTYKTANVTLSAGYYKLTAEAFNNNPDATQIASRLGFVPTSGDPSFSSTTVFTYGSWVTDCVYFYLANDTEGYFLVGGQAVSGGSGANAKIFIDNLKLYWFENTSDYTSSVNTSGWKKGDGSESGTATGNGIALREIYSSSSSGTKLYQEISNLKNGIYDVTLYATSHNARREDGASLNGKRDDLAFIFAKSGDETKKSYFSAFGVEPGFKAFEPLQCTINGITVKDGKINLGLGLEEAGLTGWHTIQIKSLVRISGLDLTEMIEAYEQALSNANTTAAKPMNASVKATLDGVIDTYGEGKVDLESEDELTTATDALNNAADACSESIGIYKAINDYKTTTANKVGLNDSELADVNTKYNNGTYVTLAEAIVDIKAVRNTHVFSQETIGDLTVLIDNNSFELGNTNYWTVGASTDTGARSTTNPTYYMSDSDGDWLFNTWSQGIPITQNIGKLPAGKYTLSAVVASDGARIYMKVNDAHDKYVDTYDKTAGIPLNYVFTIDEEKEVTIGVVGGNNDQDKTYVEEGYWWYKADNFQLSIAKIKDVATELSENSLVADEWYYFDVPSSGDYTITCNDLTKVVYTRNGEDVYNTTQTNAFSTPMTLEAGKYYFKSSEAQTITFTPATYTYTIGEPTINIADGSYIQQIETITFAFNPFTDDPNPPAFSLLDNTLKPTFGSTEGLFSLDGNVLTATFSGVTLEPASQYTLTIPAGTVGFDGEVSNEAITLTLNTPSVFDGTYYLYDATAKLFFGRGASWGTQAVVDKYGVPFNWKTDATGIGSIEFLDWLGVYLFETSDGYIFTDNQSTGWIFNKVTDGYNLLNRNGSKYTNNDGNVVSFCDASAATVWTLMSKEDHDAILAAYPADNEANVATAAGVSDDLAAYIATLTAVDMTDKIGTARFDGAIGDWTFTQVRGQDWQPAYGTDWAEVFQATGSYTQTVEGLSPGIYKVTVNAFERRGGNDIAYSLGENGYDNVIGSYLNVNGEQVQIASWYEAAEKNGNAYKPNNTGEAVEKFDAGNYVNEVYAYVGEDGKLTITLTKQSYTPGCWMLFNNFTLTYYAEPVVVNIGEVGYATLYYENLNLQIPSDVTVSIVNDVVDGKTLSFSDLSDVIPAGTGVILNGPKGEYTFNVVAEADPITLDNMLAGTDTDKTIETSGYKYYVLTTKDNNPASVGFYFNVKGGMSVNNKAHKAYLAVPEESNPANEFLFQNADGITTILQNANSANGEVYTISGTRVNGKVLTKGVYIVNGQKVVIK